MSRRVLFIYVFANAVQAGITKYKKEYIVMYITSIVFTLIAWGAGLLLDANIHFGDPQGFLCLRVLLPVLAMGLCLLRAMKENRRDGDK